MHFSNHPSSYDVIDPHALAPLDGYTLHTLGAGSYAADTAEMVQDHHREIRIVHHERYEEMLAAIKNQPRHAAMLPVENAKAGTVRPHQNALIADPFRFRTLAEAHYPVDLTPCGVQGSSMKDAVTLRTHPVAFTQCSAFLNRYPHLERVDANSTAEAAEIVASLRDPRVIALSSRKKIQELGLVPLNDEPVTDLAIPENTTLMHIIADASDDLPAVDDAATHHKLYLRPPNISGIMAVITGIFKKYDTNMRSIYSGDRSADGTYPFLIVLQRLRDQDPAAFSAIRQELSDFLQDAPHAWMGSWDASYEHADVRDRNGHERPDHLIVVPDMFDRREYDIAIEPTNEAGVLHDILKELRNVGIGLTNLESKQEGRERYSFCMKTAPVDYPDMFRGAVGRLIQDQRIRMLHIS